ncbi:hypothetical protein JYT61_00465 [bacterium AH-315-E10]|nr:hypothetical protein [bacterium AH-315-E10]
MSSQNLSAQQILANPNRAINDILVAALRIPGAAIKVLHLPLGILKSLFGSVWPNKSIKDGVPDLKTGAMAPVYTVIEIIKLPIAVLGAIL